MREGNFDGFCGVFLWECCIVLWRWREGKGGLLWGLREKGGLHYTVGVEEVAL